MSKTVTVRLTDFEFERLENISAGKPISEAIRDLILKVYKEETNRKIKEASGTKETSEIVDELIKKITEEVRKEMESDLRTIACIVYGLTQEHGGRSWNLLTAEQRKWLAAKIFKIDNTRKGGDEK